MARICIIRQQPALEGPRVRREMYALIDAGHAVDVICTRRPGEPRRERDGSLTIHRLPMAHRRGGSVRYLFEYVGFPMMAAGYLAWLDRRRRFDLVQVHSLPDWLVFAAAAPRLRGAPVVLDLMECMPEFFSSKFGANRAHPAVRILKYLERASIKFAGRVMTCTEQMRATFLSRGAPEGRIEVVMNSADESIFDPNRFPRRRRRNGRFSLISHGAVEERYGLDTIVCAVDRLRSRIPGLVLNIYGEGSFTGQLLRMIDDRGLHQHVIVHGYVPRDQLVAAIADADAGVVAMKRDPFRDLTHCNKMYELIAMRRPVICSRTASVMSYFPEGTLKYFEAGDEADLARAIQELYEDPKHSRDLVRRATRQNEAYRWPSERQRYLAVIDDVLSTAA